MKSKQDQAIKQVLEQCVQCSICVKECTFLQQNGDPKKLAKQFQDNPDSKTPFSCSLCGLCTAVCPKEVDPAELFLLWRRSRVATDNLKFKAHNPLRSYERMGGSKLLSWYGLPSGCDTIFFPGCALPGTRAQRVADVIQELQTAIPGIGVLLDCCTKPSHDLGDHAVFQKQFQRIQTFLDHNSIRTVLVACPNCYRMFKEYGRNIKVQTIYERLSPKTGNPPHKITIHDPCGVRFYPKIHKAVRTLLKKSNGHITEMKHHGTKTICCGEGGAVGFLDTQLAENWISKRADEAGKKKVITYCAGCTHFLGQEMDASHILDFLFEPEKTTRGEEEIAKSPFTYYHRFRLKKTLGKLLRPAQQGNLCS